LSHEERTCDPLDFKAAEESANEQLLQEMRLNHEYDASQLGILEELVGNLDQWGYLREPTSAIASRLMVSEKMVENIRCDLRNLNDEGIGSRNFSEFLRLQLSQKVAENAGESYRQCFREVLKAGNLENFMHYMRRLAKVLSGEMFQFLTRALTENRLRSHPRSGESKGFQYSGSPDLLVRLVDGDAVEITVPEDTFHGEGEFLRHLQIALSMRRETLRKIGEYIFQCQKSFLTQGISALRPLTQLQISREVGLAPSSISRALSEKYVKTPHGIFPLKNFAVGDLRKSKMYIAHFIDLLLRNIPDAYLFSNQQLADHIQKSFRQKFSRKSIAHSRAHVIPHFALRALTNGSLSSKKEPM
jgi:RNA polymerase sigma-54 factor